MAIDLRLKRHLVFFEIDNATPHDLSRFHRIISQAIAMGRIGADDFEEVIGSYEGKMNVAYCLTAPAWVHLKGVLAVYMINQREVYAYSLDAFWLLSFRYSANSKSWVQEGEQVAGWSAGNSAPDAPGWTYFPSSGLYFTIDVKEAV